MKRRRFIKTLAIGSTLISCQPLYAANWKSKKNSLSVARFCRESERNIPIIDSVDIIVVGGTTAAVAAASRASRNGARVFLIAPRLYLGEDVCATLRLEIDGERTFKTDLEKKLFGSDQQTTPTKVKDILIQTLEEAGVNFVFSSVVTDLLWDKEQKPAGIIMANRSGRQAVKSKVLIDASDQAWVGRMAGAKSYSWKGSTLNFQRTVIESTPDYEGKPVQYDLTISMADLHFPSFARAEQIARDKTYTKGQWRASERLFHIPPNPVVCKRKAREWSNPENPHIDHFKPEGIERLYILSGSADIPRKVAKNLLKPAGMAKIGEKIGSEAAGEAKKLNTIDVLELKNNYPSPTVQGDTKEVLKGLRSIDKNLPQVHCTSHSLPVFGEYDVVIAGGGTAGAASAIAAARRGEQVLVMEYQEGLGGTGTVGLIGKPYHGQKVGFASEVPFPEKSIEPKMEWYRREIRKAGGEIWFGVISCGAYVQKNHIKGIVVATPENRGVVLAKVVIDATGNGDIAIAAGAGYRYGTVEEDQIALQGTGYPMRPLFGSYVNTDYLLVDESDMIDVRRSIIGVTKTKGTKNDLNINYGKYTRKSISRSEIPYDIAPFIQNRERRRIVGDYTMTYLDQIAGRTHPDAIVYSGSDYDSHGYPSSPYFALFPHDEESLKANHPAPGGTAYTPYRCLLPRGLEGIIVVGLSISMDRDATALMRMQLDISNQGYAAGIAASMAIRSGVKPRSINVGNLQKHLVDKGNLPESVINQKDSFPLSEETIRQAIHEFGEATDPQSAGKPLAIIKSHKEKALPLLREQHKEAPGRKKLLYAQVLGIWGCREAIPTLQGELQKYTEWDDKILQGRMADYAHLPTPIDSIILAMGYTGDQSVTQHILKWLNKLNEQVTLSHHRSIALALETLGDPAAVKPLAELLQKTGMQGYNMTNAQQTAAQIQEGDKWRTRSLRESILARVLYHLGDYNGLGKSILQKYTKDIRGLFARHAIEVLES